MLITITTDNGVRITQPTEKWLVAILVALADQEPAVFAKVCLLVDNKVDAYATIPTSVQESLTGS